METLEVGRNKQRFQRGGRIRKTPVCSMGPESRSC